VPSKADPPWADFTSIFCTLFFSILSLDFLHFSIASCLKELKATKVTLTLEILLFDFPSILAEAFGTPASSSTTRIELPAIIPEP